MSRAGSYLSHFLGTYTFSNSEEIEDQLDTMAIMFVEALLRLAWQV